MNYEPLAILRDACSALRTATPLPDRLDCGKLCGGRCCRGTENDGMELFHGEDALFKDDPRFTIRTDGTRKLLICGGVCTRRTRPLACRMYPLFPVPVDTPDGLRMHVVYDLRGFGTCPIVQNRLRIDPRFAAAVRKAGMILARDPVNLAILRDTGALFDEWQTLTQRLSGTKE